MSKRMFDIPISELTVGDIGSRIVIIRDGKALDGVLRSLFFYQHESFRGVDEWSDVKGSLKISVGPNVGADLERLPAEYRVQIERDDDGKAGNF